MVNILKNTLNKLLIDYMEKDILQEKLLEHNLVRIQNIKVEKKVQRIKEDNDN